MPRYPRTPWHVRTAMRILLAGVLAAVFGAACFFPDSGPGGVSVAAEESAVDLASLEPWEQKTVEIFREASRSVVFISTNMAVQRGYFDLRVEEVQGTGSGFVWDSRGHIVTNYHVVRKASSVNVTLSDQSVHRAELVGVYADKEIAVLKINAPASKLHPLKIGRSGNLIVGMTALAIGNPFGLDHTLTVGVISALAREIPALTGRQINDVIQTDAAINPGNSGGPLLNSRGQLIGMTTAIMSPSGVNAGIGFAVPVDTVRRYVEQIIRNNGKISQAGLGVGLAPDALTRRLGFKGALITVIDPKGAAARAGLRGTRAYRSGQIEQLGDIITAVDGDKVETVDALRDALERRAVGDETTITYHRDEDERKVKVQLQQIQIQGEE